MVKKVVLITGASSGFGKLSAEKLLERGFIVYGAARRVEKMKGLKEKGAIPLVMDVTSDEQVDLGIARIISEQGRVDTIVNNAGYGSYGMIECVSMDDAHKQFEVNVFGAIRVIKAVLPHMRKQGRGNIVNISSVIGRVYAPIAGWYGASKHALEALSDSLRAEVKQFGIKVSLIEPGAVKTDFFDVAMKRLEDVEHHEAYKKQVQNFKKLFASMYDKAPGPGKVADTIVKAIESKNPKTRYAVGNAMSEIMLGKIMSDKTMDNMMNKMMST